MWVWQSIINEAFFKFYLYPLREKFPQSSNWTS